MSEKPPPPDQFELISLRSGRLRSEMQQSGRPVDLLALAGLVPEPWEQIDAAAYLELEGTPNRIALLRPWSLTQLDQ